MRVYDPADREYEPAIHLFRATRIKPSRHRRIAGWGFGLFIGLVVLFTLWQSGAVS